MQKPELLAPAGSWEALIAAVQNGADAVYLGGKAFNARQSAANFGNDDLARAVEYCHVRGVKVYVTVNIIIADHELAEAMDFLHHLHNIGVDAVILQDLGLAMLARKVLPELPIHASTQMTVHNAPGVQLLLDMGFERVVLSREVSLKDITQIKQNTGADLEVFTHGALCICYSGQCLMSSLIGGRSGNRGRCAQPCRMQYQLVDQRGRSLADNASVGEYLLSPRDLNISEHVPDLMAAGVNSFKIEGRMKRPEYVATVIRVYRELIDSVLAQDNFKVTPQQSRELTQIFNRDFTTGYFFGNPGSELMSYKRPNNRGILLGRVKRFSKDSDLVELALQESLRVGDGIEVWVTQGGRVGVEIPLMLINGQRVENAAPGTSVWIPIPGKVRPGDRVFKTHDADLVERARASYTSAREIRSIPIKFLVKAAVGEPLHLKVEDHQGFAAEARSQEVGQQAEKRPLTKEFLAEQLNRLGNTPFTMDQLHCDIQGQVMFPMRVINELRRTVLEDLEKQRYRSQARIFIHKGEYNKRLNNSMAELEQPTAGTQGKPKLSVIAAELAVVKAVVDAGADVVYFGGESYRSNKPITLEDIKTAGDYCHRRGADFILSTPRVLQEDELKVFNQFLRNALPHVQGVLVGNLGLLNETHLNKPVIGDFPLNVFNRATVVALKDYNVIRATLSPELTMTQIKNFGLRAPLPLETLIHGALPIMVTEHCTMGSLMGGMTAKNKCSVPCRKETCGLKDRKGIIFPVRVDQFCHQHIFNSRELCLIEDIGTLATAGISSLRIDARIMDSQRAEAVVKAYRRVLEIYPGKQWQDVAEFEKGKLEVHTDGFTKGHYYRGVI